MTEDHWITGLKRCLICFSLAEKRYPLFVFILKHPEVQRWGGEEPALLYISLKISTYLEVHEHCTQYHLCICVSVFVFFCLCICEFVFVQGWGGGGACAICSEIYRISPEDQHLSGNSCALYTLPFLYLYFCICVFLYMSVFICVFGNLYLCLCRVEESRVHFAARSIGYLARILQTLNCISAQQHPPKPAQMHPDVAPRCIHEQSGRCSMLHPRTSAQ